MNTLESPMTIETTPEIADTLLQFLSFKEKLRVERADLLRRVAEIDKALNLNGTTSKRPTGRPVQSKGALTLPQAVERVLTQPMTKQEILEAIQKAGWHTKSKDPMNVLNQHLYSGDKYRRKDGKFSLK